MRETGRAANVANQVSAAGGEGARNIGIAVRGCVGGDDCVLRFQRTTVVDSAAFGRRVVLRDGGVDQRQIAPAVIENPAAVIRG